MRKTDSSTIARMAVVTALVIGSMGTAATATEPCEDFGECKVLIEINASDGDIGFHFLMDGDDLLAATIRDPEGQVIFRDRAFGPLGEQFLTETFAESAEPLCWEDPEADPEDLEDVVTLADFLDLWTAGTYEFFGRGEAEEMSSGSTELTYSLPAAPTALDFDGSVISWSKGNDLGNCADLSELTAMVNGGVLPEHPADVVVAAWEIVLEPDVDDGDPIGALKFTIRVPGDIAPMMVTVPADYLASLPDDTPVKIEVGAIGDDDNATFWEEDGFCVNESAGC